jgi:hypothetical protein
LAPIGIRPPKTLAVWKVDGFELAGGAVFAVSYLTRLRAIRAGATNAKRNSTAGWSSRGTYGFQHDLKPASPGPPPEEWTGTLIRALPEAEGTRWREPKWIRREYEFGVGSIASVAKKLGIHRRMLRETIGSALPRSRKKTERQRWVVRDGQIFCDACPVSPASMRVRRNAPRRSCD